MRDPFVFVVPIPRRKPFTLTAAVDTGHISMVCPIAKGMVRMPVQGPFRAAVLGLVDIGAIVVPNGAPFPAEVPE